MTQQKVVPRCPVHGCSAHRKRWALMCARHWYTVPKSLRDRVWKEYRSRPGSLPHRRACMDAIQSANQQARSVA